ncbi:nuclear transcription factor Y subunit B-3-like [Pyrus ussuriensis x Pyrus communis]|uniref:Nuclear transcription factor Y subunit B-3-like n=1 Tax=Pyrus ussuriensis x Pyrus communis TaxID=2448454 RepID=A0A5N5FT99_9ROSA|nr:nuclear transcription factor Y subunit B-3-like [Pyrus ussuriensis x Pyrus communis]
MADSDNDSGGAHGKSELSPREQDRLLPIANVSRIMKKALPANAKISKDAKETVQECASDKCQREKRKTINGDDLLWAMTTLGFEEYVEPLKVYLQRFREMEGRRAAWRRVTRTGAVAESVGLGMRGVVVVVVVGVVVELGYIGSSSNNSSSSIRDTCTEGVGSIRWV